MFTSHVIPGRSQPPARPRRPPRRPWWHWLLFTCRLLPCLLVALAGPSPAGEGPPLPHILLLNSYHPGYLWSDGELTGMLHTLEAEMPQAQLHIEYLDTKNFPGVEHYQFLRDSLAYKYGNTPFSLIMTADNAALDFLARFGAALFGDTPVVFCGVSNYSPKLLGELQQVTGVVERHDVRSTLEAILRLHPSAREIFTVVDDTLTGRELRRFTEELLPTLRRPVTMRFTDQERIADVLHQLRALPRATPVLILTYARDRDGVIFDLPELARLVSEAAPSPVYVLQEERLGTGVLGGFVLGGKAHGAQAARLALRVLHGEAASSIPVVTAPPAQPIFDHLQLQRFGLKASDLPEGSELVNKPPSLYETHKKTVWTITLFILSLLGAIITLTVNVRRRQLAERVLRQHRAMLRQILDTVPLSIFWKDRQSVYLGCNALFARDAGLDDPDEVRGKTDFDLPWRREETEAYRADDRAVMETKRGRHRFVEPQQLADGRGIWVETSKMPLLDQAGQVYGVLGVYGDITERKAMEEQLFLRLFSINAVRDGIFLVDQDARFLFVNDGACRRLGYAREELLTMDVFDIDPFFSREQWGQHWCQLMEQGTILLETMQQTREGERFPVEISANLVMYEDKAFNCALVRDISERKAGEEDRHRLEGQLRQAQKMEAIGTLAGGIAHDFNNILGVIVGNAELSQAQAGAPDKLQHHLAQILVAAERARLLVQQILAFSRKSEQEKLPLQVSLIVKEALKMLRASIPTTIDFQEHINSTGLVLADPTQIHQVVMNLCTNAYHAMRDHGGTLTVRLDEEELGPAELHAPGVAAGRYLRLEVRDTGPGIDPAIRDKIFEPYFTTKGLGEGTGMGLAVVHGIVRGHNGQILVESELGRGTAMRVYLPLTAREPLPAVETTRASAETASGRGKRILLVDDEEQLGEALRLNLLNNGYQVTLRTSPQEAWLTFAQNPGQFDAMVTDMTMPGMTGAELAQQVLSLRPGLPIVLCTGFSALIDRNEARSLGISEFLAKPVAAPTLLTALQRILPGQ